MAITDVLCRISSALDKAGIPYMLTGSFASAYYATPRSTQDLDLVVEASRDQLQLFVQSLAATEYYADLDAALEAHERRSMFNVIDLVSGWKLDFIIRKSRPFSFEEFHRRREVIFEGNKLFVASAEDVIISKLEWAKLAQSQRQIDDAARVLKARNEFLDKTYLATWVRNLGVEKEWSEASAMAGT